MAESVQSYKRHARWLPPYHFFVMPVLLINVAVAARPLWDAPSLTTAFGVLLAIALLLLGLLSRTQALTAQDRVIRLEMRLRLQQLLPSDLQPRIRELTPRQLIALRFASDEELPELVRDVLNGKLASSNEIKMRVRDWQGDWLRV
jgi:hypothetical protein